MARHRLSGLVVESNFPLPELLPAAGRPAFLFELRARRRVQRRHRWYHHWTSPGDRPWLSFARTPSGYLLRFPALADFELSRDATTVCVRPARGVPPETLRHLLLDQVWPLALSGSGQFVIHASAVVLPDGRAIAFAGPAGVGKSSLAAMLASAGCRVVCDDCLRLEQTGSGWRAVPSYPGLRLWPDMLARVEGGVAGASEVAHYTSKKRVAGDALPFAGRAASLAALYLVQPRAGRARVTIAPVNGAAALMDLVPLAYLLDHRDREQLERSFAQLAALTTAIPVLRLSLPHTGRLAEVTALLMRSARVA